jgi:membrane fusion protein (multidrug efflux system)
MDKGGRIGWQEASHPPRVLTARPKVSVAALKRLGLILALLGGCVIAAQYGYNYWTTGQYFVSTDDAYVAADSSTISPKISGYIDNVGVQDNQAVAASQVVAHIDDRDIRTTLAQARADVEAAAAEIQDDKAQIVLQQALVSQAKAEIAVTDATLAFAQGDATRYRTLARSGAGTQQLADKSLEAALVASAQMASERSAYTATVQKISVLSALVAESQARLDVSRAEEAQAELNLSYTTIRTPIAGTVGARTLRVGQYVTPGTPLLAVVPLDSVYVVANYKETQLTNVASGQAVNIKADAFPSVQFKGVVNSLAPASGLEFALLPPDNATGNFTKIVQRIPVKITISANGPALQLRPGMSVEVSIDTRRHR